MNSEQKALQRELKKRQSELRQLVEQMRSDQLNKSKVCTNLENELATIGEQLKATDKKG